MAITLSIKKGDTTEVHEREVQERATLIELLKLIQVGRDGSVVGALVDNQVRDLSSSVDDGAVVKFLDLSTLDGVRIYQRSAFFVLVKAVHDLYPEACARILHSVANGLYVELLGGPKLDRLVIDRIESRMKELVEADLPIVRKSIPIRKALDHFKAAGEHDKVRLLSYKSTASVHVYEIEGKVSYFFGYLAPSTGFVRRFSLSQYDNGILIHLPSVANPDKIVQAKKTKKLFEVFKETARWRRILQVEDVGMLNEVIRSQQCGEFVHLAEAMHEKKIAQIADTIKPRSGVKVVLLSGPSASGKTTFTKRLGFQLRINGFKPFQVSMDDYFLDRDKTPRTPEGEHDFESPYAINVELFKENLRDIIAGKEVRLPRYDFKSGKSTPFGKVIHPDHNSIILIEGIHGLNPIFSADLPHEAVYKIYVSALCEVPLDHHNRIPTTDIRFLRRILRDSQFRNYSAEETIMRWPLVREGETKYIFRHQEEADVLFNTALIYELAALKVKVEPLLRQVTPDSPAYAEALRLTKFLSFLLPIPTEVIPPHSILREFLGGGYFSD